MTRIWHRLIHDEFFPCSVDPTRTSQAVAAWREICLLDDQFTERQTSCRTASDQYSIVISQLSVDADIASLRRRRASSGPSPPTAIQTMPQWLPTISPLQYQLHSGTAVASFRLDGWVSILSIRIILIVTASQGLPQALASRLTRWPKL